MKFSNSLLSELHLIRNRYESDFAEKKLRLLNTINCKTLSTKNDIELYYHTLLFLLAYPDNPKLYQKAAHVLQQLEEHVLIHKQIRNNLYNTGITQTQLCASYSFELVKWLRQIHPDSISINSIDASDSVIQSILSVVMPKVESEILQDANYNWKTWFKKIMAKDESLLDRLIRIFDESDIRPEVKDELWSSLEINVEISFSEPNSLPSSLFDPFYHTSILKSKESDVEIFKHKKAKLSLEEAAKIIECGRMALVRHFREIDPITFSAPQLVSYYKLSRGISIALLSMTINRRHPIDSYIGYLVFKNGLPVAYAGSWIFFDSARIGLNIFHSYRGGESFYIFKQILNLHKKVYRLARFSVDPYQIGKENHDGIHSGAFWVYYHAGFRPLKKIQQELAKEEADKLNSIKGYRSPFTTLKKLADSRMELIMSKKAVPFDVTDLSIAYIKILKDKFNNDRKMAEDGFINLAKKLKIKNYPDANMQYVLKNWSALLLSRESEWGKNSRIKKQLKDLFELKSFGKEETYIFHLQKSKELKALFNSIFSQYTR